MLPSAVRVEGLREWLRRLSSEFGNLRLPYDVLEDQKRLIQASRWDKPASTND
jgi:hypothetical protein